MIKGRKSIRRNFENVCNVQFPHKNAAKLAFLSPKNKIFPFESQYKQLTSFCNQLAIKHFTNTTPKNQKTILN